MKKYAFIGGYDKTEILLFLAKICILNQKKVLIVDTTVSQKTRYIVPVMKPTQKYITTFEDIDIAVGFKSFEEILEYICEEKSNNDAYKKLIINKLQPLDTDINLSNLNMRGRE